MPKMWEDNVALGNSEPYAPQDIGPVANYLEQENNQVNWRRGDTTALADVAARDLAPLPSTIDREGYYGDNHFNYWASGLADAKIMAHWLAAQGRPLNDYLDIGCASGRVIRHMPTQIGNVRAIGCDINRTHVDWCNTYMPESVMVFQNTSLPHLPLADNSVDLISAFSVFTHIEAFDTAWMMELRRILRPGGIAWITIHGDRTWSELKPTWPLYTPLTTHPDYAQYQGMAEIPASRLVFRWNSETSYSANVFYRYSYIRQLWGRILKVEDIIPAEPDFQDVVILSKPL